MTRIVQPFVPGNVWLLRHRCFNDQPLFDDPIERRRYLYWLFQARRRFGLSILNYSIHRSEFQLLCMDKGRGEIPCSMHLLADGIAGDIKARKDVRSAIWENQYHAAVIASLSELPKTLTSMDVSVVHAGLTKHPIHWRYSGFFELQNPPPRARRIDFNALQQLLHPLDFTHLQTQRQAWVHRALHAQPLSPLDSLTSRTLQPLLTVRRAYRSQESRLRPAKLAAPELVPKRFNT